MWLTIVLTVVVITLFRLNSATDIISIQFHQTKVVEEELFQIINETEGRYIYSIFESGGRVILFKLPGLN